MRKRVFLIVAALGLLFIVWFVLVRAQQYSRSNDSEIETDDARGTTDKDKTLRDNLFGIRWVAYAPTNWNPEASPPVLPSEESLRKDLQVLREANFDGLVTYGADLVSIPRIAEQVGFRGLLQGVWDPTNRDEMQRAKQIAAESNILVGIIVGNEGITFHRYDMQSLKQAMDEMKRETRKPVSTTEIIESYFSIEALVAWSDFLAPNAHPFFHGKYLRNPERAVEWTREAFRRLEERAGGKPLLFKEVGLPTGGTDGLSEEAQARYYALLAGTEVRFVYFEAFDSPWKTGSAIEPHWGLFRSNRSPKLAAQVIAGKKSLKGPVK